jgi:hypothetical protein
MGDNFTPNSLSSPKIIMFENFVHHSEFKLENIVFRQLDLLPSSGKKWGLGPLERANLNQHCIIETYDFEMVLIHDISAGIQLVQVNQRVAEDSYNSPKFISKTTCLRFTLAFTL